MPWVTHSPPCLISPPPITEPSHFIWLLVIISNNLNLIWQSLLPDRYWSHPEWDADWNLVLCFICLYIVCCPIRGHLHSVFLQQEAGAAKTCIDMDRYRLLFLLKGGLRSIKSKTAWQSSFHIAYIFIDTNLMHNLCSFETVFKLQACWLRGLRLKKAELLTPGPRSKVKYHGVLFTSDARVEQEMDKLIGALYVLMRALPAFVVLQEEPSNKTKLLVYHSIEPQPMVIRYWW